MIKFCFAVVRLFYGGRRLVVGKKGCDPINDSLCIEFFYELKAVNEINLVSRVFHLPKPKGAREERPCFGSVTCLPKSER